MFFMILVFFVILPHITQFDLYEGSLLLGGGLGTDSLLAFLIKLSSVETLFAIMLGLSSSSAFAFAACSIRFKVFCV